MDKKLNEIFISPSSRYSNQKLHVQINNLLIIITISKENLRLTYNSLHVLCIDLVNISKMVPFSKLLT